MDQHLNNTEIGEHLTCACGLPPTLSLRLEQEVRQAARVFERPAPPRPSRILRELRTLESRLESNSNGGAAPPEHLWSYLFVVEDYELEALIADREAYLHAVRWGLEALEESYELAQSRKGGRYPDPRLHMFVMRLALIYRRYAERDTTFTIDPDTHQPSGPFTRLVDEAIHQFHPEREAPPGQLRATLQHTRQFLRDTENLSPTELDHLIPKEPLES